MKNLKMQRHFKKKPKMVTLFQAPFLPILGSLMLLFLAPQSITAQKTVQFEVITANKTRHGISVRWGRWQHEVTDASGRVTFKRCWLQKRKPGSKVTIRVESKGKIAFEEKHDDIVLQEGITTIHCKSTESKKWKKAEDKSEESIDITKVLATRNQNLIKDIQKLELDLMPRLIAHLNRYPHSVMNIYKDLLKRNSESCKQTETVLTQQNTALKELLAELNENNVALKDAESTLQQAETTNQRTKEQLNKQSEQVAALRKDVEINLDNDPDQDIPYVYFGSTEYRLSDAYKSVLEDYAYQKLRKLSQLRNEEIAKGMNRRNRYCVLKTVGYADSRTYAKAEEINPLCDAAYRDSKDANKCLSFLRANSVGNHLIPLFKKDWDIQLKVEAPVGMGKEFCQDELIRLQDLRITSEERTAYTNRQMTQEDFINLRSSKVSASERDDIYKKWRKCTVSSVYMSKIIYDTYAAVR